MLSEEEIETCKEELNNYIEFMESAGDNAGWARGLKWYIEQLETENINLKQIQELGLNKEKQYCFNEDGHTNKCLGYGDDELCDYCKGCDRINIKEDD